MHAHTPIYIYIHYMYNIHTHTHTHRHTCNVYLVVLGSALAAARGTSLDLAGTKAYNKIGDGGILCLARPVCVCVCVCPQTSHRALLVRHAWRRP